MASIPGQVKALIFDVFGTLVDWRTSVAHHLQQALSPLGIQADWLAVADAWRAQYDPSMAAVRDGRLPFCKLDVLHRHNLDTVMREQGWDIHPGVDEALLEKLNLAWHRLDAWPDVSAGLTALRERFLLAPCSNGNIALMADLARHNGWHWDAILGAEVAGDYKPKPEVYLRSCEAFNLAPEQVMMVAAHSNDLAAAAACGLRTAFVARPEEFGGLKRETQARVPVDVSVESLDELVKLAQ